MKGKKSRVCFELQSIAGFSLVGTLVAVGIIGVVIVGVMQVMDNLSVANQILQNSQNKSDVSSMARMIIGDSGFCRLSLAGTSFQKNMIDEPSKSSEGAEVELWLGDQSRTMRTSKKLSSTDNTVNHFGGTKISSIKLFMDNGVGSNYAPNSSHSDLGQLVITTLKKVGKKERADQITIPLMLTMSTDLSGTTQILGCEDSHSNQFEGVTVAQVIDCQGSGVTVCNYDLSTGPNDYTFFRIDDECSSKCSSGDGGVTLKVKDSSSNTLFTGTTCHVEGVDHNQTNKNRNLTLLPRVKNAASLEVSVHGCGGQSSRSIISLVK